MYQHSFDELDAHHWKYMWVNLKGVPEEHQECEVAER